MDNLCFAASDEVSHKLVFYYMCKNCMCNGILQTKHQHDFSQEVVKWQLSSCRFIVILLSFRGGNPKLTHKKKMCSGDGDGDEAAASTYHGHHYHYCIIAVIILLLFIVIVLISIIHMISQGHYCCYWVYFRSVWATHEKKIVCVRARARARVCVCVSEWARALTSVCISMSVCACTLACLCVCVCVCNGW